MSLFLMQNAKVGTDTRFVIGIPFDRNRAGLLEAFRLPEPESASRRSEA